jgi:hypothetical protein
MNTNLAIKRRGWHYAEGTPIVLRTNNSYRLIFKPGIVDKPESPKECINGEFWVQRKGPSDEWSDYKDFDLTKLKAGESVKLELHSRELYTLITELDKYFQIFEKYGLRDGTYQQIMVKEDVAEFLGNIDNDEGFQEILLSNSRTLVSILKWISSLDASGETIAKIKLLKSENLRRLNLLLNITELERIYQVWIDNKENDDEGFWQSLFSSNPWVISHAFATPCIIFDDKAYVGGKAIDNKKGKIVDFIYSNHFTDNVSIVEIKTPSTPLLDRKIYRENTNYSLSRETSGAIIQLLTYRENLEKDFYSLSHQTPTVFNAFNPRCLLIIGSIKSIHEDITMLSSFETFRNSQSYLDIITFDELFEKIKMLLSLLTQDSSDEQYGDSDLADEIETSSYDDLPF